MAKPTHKAQRAIADLTLGVVKASAAKAARDDELGLVETDQQYQFNVSGTAQLEPAFSTVALTLDFPFHYAPAQRDSDLETPHLGVGSEVSVVGVILTASVLAWDQDPDTGGYIGATLVFGVHGTADTDFTGKLHLTFQGYSAPDDQPDVVIET